MATQFRVHYSYRDEDGDTVRDDIAVASRSPEQAVVAVRELLGDLVIVVRKVKVIR